MKKIGLAGGISWVSTADYYRYINEGINAKLGRLNFAECIDTTRIHAQAAVTFALSHHT
jgi:aspartate/glutamate racemase